LTTVPLLQLIQVNRRFEGTGAAVLSDINLTIHAGEFVCIHGPSGSGKSTLLNILGCLDRPSEGRLLIKGQDIWALPAKVDEIRRATFGFIFQKYALITALDVRQNIELPAIYARRPDTEKRRDATSLIERFGLSHRTTQKPNLLSGGEQQRVSIARALVNRPRVILADEPTGALDSANSRQVMKTIRDLHRAGHTVVLITHDRSIAETADRIVTLKDGRIEHDTGTAAQSEDIAPRADLSIDRAASISRSGRAQFQILKSAIDMGLTSIARKKLQSGLTILGIMIGIGSVFAMLTVGTAANRQVVANIENLGADLVTVSRGPPGVRGAERAVVTLTPPDIDIVRTTPGVFKATPEADGVVLARHRDRDFLVTATGTDENFPVVRDWPIAAGGFFSGGHLRQHSPVVVLGATARENLFPGGIDPVGRYLLIGRSPFLVLGVMERKGVTTGPGHDRDNQIWLPYTTANSRLFGRAHLDRIVAKTDRGASVETIKTAMRRAIMARHGMEDFSVVSLAEVIKAAKKTQSTLNLLLTAIAALALLIAGVGVMNMMLSSVSDRVSEVGIRMAVGASRGDIRSQFLVESVVLCAVGGVAGAFLGLLASSAAGAAMRLSIDLAWPPFVLALGCACGVGMLAGVLPAMRASAIQPSIAIKQE
jgi:macrolide transport system ATP-binding/permease protein